LVTIPIRAGLSANCALQRDGNNSTADSIVRPVAGISNKSCRTVCTKVPRSASKEGGSGNLSILRYLYCWGQFSYSLTALGDRRKDFSLLTWLKILVLALLISPKMLPCLILGISEPVIVFN